MVGTRWSGNPLWAGCTVAIIAGGQSLTLEQIRLLYYAWSQQQWKVLAVNDSVFPAWWADAVYASDVRWWQKWSFLPAYRGLKLGISNFIKTYPSDIHVLENAGREGFDPDPTHVRTGRNGGYQALHFTGHSGAKRICLVGFDMHGEHWFGSHEEWILKKEVVENWRTYFPELGTALSQKGIEVVNASPGSALTCFSQVDLRTLIRFRKLHHSPSKPQAIRSCPLCERKKLTKTHYEDKEFWVVDCLTCKVPMIVWKRHEARPKDLHVERIRNFGKRLFPDRRFDDSMKQIKDHYHVHFR